MFTSIDDKLSQKELDEITLKECEDAEGIGCQIRFRTLKKIKSIIDMQNMIMEKILLCWGMRLSQKKFIVLKV